MVDTSNPDIITGCETWLTPAIHDSEVLPSNYTVYRKDRPDGCGGVMVGVSNDLISEDIPINADVELKAVKVKLCDGQELIVCSAYRPRIYCVQQSNN